MSRRGATESSCGDLQFADTTQEVGAGGTADTASSPVDDYLAAAGVDPATVTMDAPDLPPTAILVDAAHAADGTSTHQDTTIDDASLGALPVEVLNQPQDDPQHHGV